MADKDKSSFDRREFMRIAGATVVTGSLAGLAGCGGGDSGGGSAPSPSASTEPAPATPEPEPVAQAPAPAPSAPAPAAPAGGAQRVTEDDPVAASLGYKHDAANVDLAKHPKRGEASAANHYCKNCVLFQGSDGDEWGPCSIFGGRLVNANGWCATYAPKAG